MRNSLLPLIVAGIVITLGALLILPRGERGIAGPQFEAGILRLSKHRLAGCSLQDQTTVSIQGATDAGAWQVVVVSGDDRRASTRAVQYALGEALFDAGIACILDPYPDPDHPEPPLPLPSTRVLRVSTPAEQLPATAAGELTATVTITMLQPGLPSDHPAAALTTPIRQPALVTVVHRSSGNNAAWPARWAASGRIIAASALKALAPNGLHAASVPDGWGSPAPMPPLVRELRWQGCFQDARVRGWVGQVSGRSVPTDKGGSEPAIAPVERILVSGRWQALADSGPFRLWQRNRDGGVQWFSVRSSGNGWDLALWQERR